MNTWQGVGRLTADPEVKQTQNNTPVAVFCVAINRPFKNQQGEREADFINVVAWKHNAEFAGNYLKKGSLVSVVGTIRTRKYQDKDGNNRTATEVQADQLNNLTPRAATSDSSGDFDPWDN